MIQSDIFDSFNMDIKKVANSTLIFIAKRLIEIFGIFLSCLGFFLFLALISYSPEDPNFIFPENTKIQNLLGFQGSVTSDLFFQSIGLISYLVAFTFIFTGINIFLKKQFLIIIENTFFVVLYSLLGSLFFSHFYLESLSLHINGNGGFVGNFLNTSFIYSVISSNDKIF